MDDRPSRAVIIVPGLVADALESAVDDALGANGYVRRDAPLPPGYPAAEREWLGFVLTAAGDRGLLLPEDVQQVFRVALWLSRADPARPLAAWRCFLLGDPVLKLFWEGEPRFKDGPDRDHEVSWPVPEAMPVGGPALGALPVRADAVELYLGPVLRPWRAAIDGPWPGERTIGYLRRTSPLAGG